MAGPGAVGPNPDNPIRDKKPYQKGAAQGDSPSGGRANEPKTWMIDTGSDISVISQTNAAHFTKTKLKGATAKARGVNGGQPMNMYEGITMVFQADDNGRPVNISCNKPVAVSQDEVAVIGNDQLEAAHCGLDWLPEMQTGRIYVKRPPPPPPASSDEEMDKFIKEHKKPK